MYAEVMQDFVDAASYTKKPLQDVDGVSQVYVNPSSRQPKKKDRNSMDIVRKRSFVPMGNSSYNYAKNCQLNLCRTKLLSERT